MTTGTSSLMDGKDYNKNNSQRFDEFMDIVKQLPQQEICINCDEEKETHEICMDCISKLIKENQQEISDEEIEKAVKDASERLSEYKEGLIDGAKWYREQLKQRQ